MNYKPSGMKAFLIVWFGQLISLFGSSLTGFALSIWAWQITGRATALALVGFFHFGPTVLFSPIAGALVDRWNRKLVMMFSDLAAGLSTIAILILYLTGRLEIWHLYIAGAFSGTFHAFQWPAYSAAISVMIPKEQYTRANGMISLAESASNIAAPIVAAFLLTLIGIQGILFIDIVTFLFAIGALILIFIPQPPPTPEGLKSRGSLLKESIYGFKYIIKKPSLLGLQLIFFASNLVATFGYTVLSPMILARTNNNTVTLGSVRSAAGLGGTSGGLFLSIWGGPKKRVNGVLLGMILTSLTGALLLGLGKSVYIWVIASFFSSFFLPLINGSNQAIWQSKVPPDIQGKVFATRRMIAQITAPVAMLIAGPVADYVLEPLMSSSNAFSLFFAPIVGMGKGTGMSLMLVLSGIFGILVGLSGYLIPVVRDVEKIVPDHDSQ